MQNRITKKKQRNLTTGLQNKSFWGEKKDYYFMSLSLEAERNIAGPKTIFKTIILIIGGVSDYLIT